MLAHVFLAITATTACYGVLRSVLKALYLRRHTIQSHASTVYTRVAAQHSACTERMNGSYGEPCKAALQSGPG
jgi:hypothetical protein